MKIFDSLPTVLAVFSQYWGKREKPGKLLACVIIIVGVCFNFNKDVLGIHWHTFSILSLYACLYAADALVIVIQMQVMS